MAYIKPDGTMPHSEGRIEKTIAESGVTGLSVTSGYRPGSTANGHPDYHSMGQAADISGSVASMDKYANFMQAKYGPVLAELIHQGPNYHSGIWNGAVHQYDEATLSEHENHVHVAAAVAALDSVGGGTVTTPVSNPVSNPVTGSVDAVTGVVKFLSDPNSWLRMSIGVVGIIMIGFGLVKVGVG